MDLLKNLDNMITAEELLKTIYNEGSGAGGDSYDEGDIERIMIEFAKLHVKEIQKLQKSKYYAGESGYIKEEEFIEILNDIK